MIRDHDIAKKIIEGLGLTECKVSNDEAVVISFNQQAMGTNQKIEVSASHSHIVIYTEMSHTAHPSLMPSINQLVGRINDYLQIGCLEISRETQIFRLKVGQIVHPSTNCVPILRNFLEYHNLISPKINESLKELIFHQKLPIEAINVLYTFN